MRRSTRTPGACNCASRPDDADIVLSVEDDGEAAGAGLAPKAGMGLLGMQERVVSLGGTLAIRAARGRRRPACRAHSHHAGGALDMQPDSDTQAARA